MTIIQKIKPLQPVYSHMISAITTRLRRALKAWYSVFKEPTITDSLARVNELLHSSAQQNSSTSNKEDEMFRDPASNPRIQQDPMTSEDETNTE